MKSILPALALVLGTSITFATIHATPQIGRILRDDQGKLLHVAQSEAIKACVDIGDHLPTARELAEAATRLMGARKILEVSYVKNELQGIVPPGWKLIKTLNPNGSFDNFYFHDGSSSCDYGGSYEFQLARFWTSSASPYGGSQTPFAFSPYSCTIDWYGFGYSNRDSVVCFKGHHK